MKNKYEFIGEKIKGARVARGWSQRQLAKAVGFKSPTAISLIESGLRRVSIQDLEKIAENLKKDLKFFIGQEEEVNLAVALRADKELSPKDQDDVIRFVEFVKNQKNGKA